MGAGGACCRATLGQHFFFSDFEPMLRLALMLRHLPLALRDHYIFAISPADPDDTAVASALLTFATTYAQQCVRYADNGHSPRSAMPLLWLHVAGGM